MKGVAAERSVVMVSGWGSVKVCEGRGLAGHGDDEGRGLAWAW